MNHQVNNYEPPTTNCELPSRSDGFTLIELLVVVAIIALLTSLALPNILKVLAKGQMTQTLSNGNQLYMATQSMAMDATTTGSTGSGWPGDAAVRAARRCRGPSPPPTGFRPPSSARYRPLGGRGCRSPA